MNRSITSPSISPLLLPLQLELPQQLHNINRQTSSRPPTENLIRLWLRAYCESKQPLLFGTPFPQLWEPENWAQWSVAYARSHNDTQAKETCDISLKCILIPLMGRVPQNGLSQIWERRTNHGKKMREKGFRLSRVKAAYSMFNSS